ncbi:MAG: cell division protein ZipA [Gammaproteobacteria bacterium]|jgi:cell division protein ZipA
MESVSVILIVVGAVIIAVVLMLRWGLRRRSTSAIPTIATPAGGNHRIEEEEFDPLFAVDAKLSEVSDGALASVGRIVAGPAEPQTAPSPGDGHDAAAASRPGVGRRRPPRVAADPHQVVALNVMAGEGHGFSGQAIRYALENSGFEYGEWQIFHYYSPAHGDAPPLFSLANMIKPGSFDLEHLDDMKTAGLSLFMVPAGEDDDIVTFDTMLAKARQLAEALSGEVRDARRSVLTRHAIGQIREQLIEWRLKNQIAHH